MAIRKAVVLAAGEGKRLRPLTYTRPKCMIQLAGKPILQHVLENLKAAGVGEAAIVVKYKKEAITEYFKSSPVEGMKLSFIEQGEKYGTAAAFGYAESFAGETFFGVAGDIITEASALRKLGAAAESQNGEVTAALHAVEDAREYGTAVIEGGKIAAFEEKVEKPKSNLANCSLYVFQPSLFRKIRRLKKSPRGEYEITDLLKGAAAVEIRDYWLDMGMPWQLFSANEFLLSGLQDNRDRVENCTIRGKIVMEKDAEVHDSVIEGNVYIGAGSYVGPHAYIRGTTSVGKDCGIGDSTTIKNSIIFDHVNAKHLTYIGDSVIGSGCNFGAATQIANYRFDAGNIKAVVNDVMIDTRRTKLGAIIGDNVKMGVLSSVMPGKIIGDGCWIDAGVVVKENVERKTHLVLHQALTKQKLE
jgi:UDP-N-acetylglucosamine diphosphorylase / glucose-1-phosphate thymidylyltransferase / UDP-N-acetylgalactosamine diphosphorylase / glucosamine-1-phosphate N-acetyltransferase / galactosamine-1-phosphate N-acetyltransferase